MQCKGESILIEEVFAAPSVLFKFFLIKYCILILSPCWPISIGFLPAFLSSALSSLDLASEGIFSNTLFPRDILALQPS